MRARCNNPQHPAFANYGARGIRVCDDWNTCDGGFERFVAHLGPRPPGMTLECIDNERGYEPGNVRWATWREQNNNKRSTRWLTLDGETLSLTEWAVRAGLSIQLLAFRLAAGWTMKEAISLAAGDGTRRHAVERAKRRPTTRHLMVNGITKTIREWAEATGLKAWTISGRLRRGWLPERAVQVSLVVAARRPITERCAKDDGGPRVEVEVTAR